MAISREREHLNRLHRHWHRDRNKHNKSQVVTGGDPNGLREPLMGQNSTGPSDGNSQDEPIKKFTESSTVGEGKSEASGDKCPEVKIEITEADRQELKRIHGLIERYHELEKTLAKEHPSRLELAAQIVSALCGLPAGFLYTKPAQAAAAGEANDTWLKNAIPSEVAREWMYFLSGFVGFDATNCTFAFYAPPEIIKLIKEQKTPAGKALAAGGIIFFTLMQGVQVGLSAIGTNADTLNLTFSGLGSLPGGLYGGVFLTRAAMNAPGAIKKAAKELYYDLRVKKLSKAERIERAKTLYYRSEHQKFKERLDCQWKAVLKEVSEYKGDGTENPFDFLMKKKAKVKKESPCVRYTRNVTQLIGGAVAAWFTVPIWANMYKVVPFGPGGSAVSTVFLGATEIYGNEALSIKGLTIAHSAVTAKLKGEPIPHLLWQLRPGAVSAIFLGSLLFAPLSYTAVDLMYKKLFPPAEGHEFDLSWNAVGRGFTRGGMAWYHFVGPSDVGAQLLLRYLKNKGTPKEKFFAHMQLMVDWLKSQSTADFRSDLENLTAKEHRELVGVKTFDEFVEKVAEKLFAYEADKVVKMIEERGLREFLPEIISLARQKIRAAQEKAEDHWSSAQYLFSPQKAAKSKHVAKTHDALPVVKRDRDDCIEWQENPAFQAKKM